MGFLDSILGRTTLPDAKMDKLFAISTAAVTLESNLDLSPSGRAAICFRPMESSKYERAKSEIEELLRISTKESGTKWRMQKDNYGFLWVVLEDRDFEDLVTTIHMISQTLIEQGFGTQLLCAVYKFSGDEAVYWIYSFKQGNYYPFVPKGDKNRDNAREFRLRSVMEKWYPLWGLPL
jgi:hypothetical protein